MNLLKWASSKPPRTAECPPIGNNASGVAFAIASGAWILLTVVTISWMLFGHRDRRCPDQLEACRRNLVALHFAVLDYKKLEGSIPVDLPTVLRCPSDGSCYHYQCALEGGRFTITCGSSAHTLSTSSDKWLIETASGQRD